MGAGRFRDGKFDLIVVANFAMSAADWTEWERSLKKASELMFNASEGQMQFGSIYVCDENIGADTAELILHPDGDPSYGTWGQFGSPGAALHLMPYVKTQPLTVIHEMGHHVWALGEEYAAPAFFDEIDKTNPAPDTRTIPIVDSGRADDELVALEADAILRFGDELERRAVVANTATTVTVDADFSDLPTNSDSDSVQYQTPAECATDVNANFCIMENSRGAAGTFDAAGVWHDAANPVTEFCTPGNHDADGDTQQDDLYDLSCWEVIRNRAEFASLAVPDPAAAGPVVGWAEPDWIVLDKQPRFALVLDRSGSMASGHKMADAQHGAVYWLEFCALSDDLLTVIWYDHAIDRILDLVQVDTLPGLDPTIDAINALTPRGSTNIRDGLFAALDQIQGPPTRAAVQVALLLTDGQHNTPSGSAASEVLPDFQRAGIRIYTLGVGSPAAVDMDVLDELAIETGGQPYAVGDDEPGLVEAAMIEINAAVRGGIITTEPALFPDARASAIDKVTKPYAEAKKDRKRPPLAEILKAVRIKSPKHLVRFRRSGRIVAIPVDVEPHCLRASFTLLYPQAHKLWLYLIDPDGAAVDMTSPGVHHRISGAPHEFAVVERPKAGRWYMVAVRPVPGPGFRFRAVAGGENRNLQVFGAASTENAAGSPVRLRASARWLHELSNLKVEATILTPSGGKVRLRMTDDASDRPSSGVYETYYTPARPGRHHAIIHVRGTGRSQIARPEHLIAHAQGGTVSLKTEAPRFVRRIPVYFDSGDRPEIKDDERAKGLVDKYRSYRPRPRKLQSANKRRRGAQRSGR